MCNHETDQGFSQLPPSSLADCLDCDGQAHIYTLFIQRIAVHHSSRTEEIQACLGSHCVCWLGKGEIEMFNSGSFRIVSNEKRKEPS